MKMQLYLSLLLLVLNFGINQPLCWADASNMEYRFESMLPHVEVQWRGSGRDIDVAPDGTLWLVTDTNILHINTDGTFISSWAYTLENISIAANGDIWGAQRGYILHYDTKGKLIGQFGSYQQFSDVAFAPDGSIWAADRGGHNIKHLDTDGRFIAQFGRLGNETGQLYWPYRIAVAPDGSLWVANYPSDHLKYRIQHFTQDGTLLNEIEILHNESSKENPNYQLGFNITVTVDGSLWVLDTDNKLIKHYNHDGSLIQKFGSKLFNESSIGIANAADGGVWVLDSVNGLSHFDPDGTLTHNFSFPDLNYAPFIQPKDISEVTTAPDNSIWVLRKASNILEHISSEGALITRFGPGDLADLHQFSDIAASVDGSLWAINDHDRSLWHLKSDGSLIEKVNPEVGIRPYQIAVSGDGSLWFKDQNNARWCTQPFQTNARLVGQASGPSAGGSFFSAAPDGSVWDVYLSYTYSYRIVGYTVNHFDSEGKVIASFNFPENYVYSSSFRDIAIAADNSVWAVILQPNAVIHHFTPTWSLLEQFSGYEQFSRPSNIAVTADHSIWVSDGEKINKFVARQKSVTPFPYKAIILAGTGVQSDQEINSLWNHTWQLAQKVKQALKFQAFKVDEEIRFLTAGDTQNDLQAATKVSLRDSIVNWAKDSSDVVLYLAGNMVAGQLQINATESLSGAELASWLTELEKFIPGKVTVVIESNDAGSFLSALANNKRPRIVITSTGAKQTTLLANHGLNSFSYKFWTQVMYGNPLQEAFVAARAAMSPFQNGPYTFEAQLDANGDGVSDAQDLVQLGDYCLGNCNKTSQQLPVINLKTPAQVTLTNATSLDFKITVQTSAALFDSWALVQRPVALHSTAEQALKLEKIPLTCDVQTQQCTGRYNRFDIPGDYRIHFYALNAEYQLNAPINIQVTQPVAQQVASVEYDDQKGLLYIYDVDLNGQHLQATLKQQNGFFRLQALSPATALYSPAAVFNPETQLLNIPLARAFGQNYQGTFKLIEGYYLYQFLAAEPK